MKPPTFVLIRHARTAWNRQNRFNSTVDLPLDEDGSLAAQGLAESLALLKAPIVTSPARRARETAVPLVAASGQSVAIDPRLAEVSFGRFEGATPTSLAEDAAFASWKAGHEVPVEPQVGEDPALPPPEPLPVAGRRLLDFFEDAQERFATRPTVVVVGHGVALRVLVCVGVLGLPAVAYPRLRLDNAHAAVVSPIADAAGCRLAAWNVPPSAVAALM